MKILITATLLILIICTLTSVEFKDIIGSNDVMAYTLNGQLFIMDINTGYELELDAEIMVEDVIWDRKGKQIYYSILASENSSLNTQNLVLYKITPPILKPIQLAECKYDDKDQDFVEIRLGKDGNIYFIGKKYPRNADWDKTDPHETLLGYYNPPSNKYINDLQAIQKIPEYYNSSVLNNITTKDYTIKSIISHDSGFNHPELYILKSYHNEGEEFRRLTNFGPRQKTINIKDTDIDFMISPNDSLIVYSYHYCYSKLDEDFAYSCVASLDGKYSEFLTLESGLFNANRFFWTRDSRLVFLQEVDNVKGGWKICLLDKKRQIKVLKVLGDYDIVELFYRLQ
jgi:hypothetical protein